MAVLDWRSKQMLLFPKDGIIAIRAEYSPSFTKLIRKVPGAQFKGWEWQIPQESLPLAKTIFELTEAHYFPYLMEHINRNAFSNIKVHLNENTEVVTIKAPPEDIEKLTKNIVVLCGYEQVIDRTVKGKGRVYERNYNTLLKDLEQNDDTLTFRMPIGLSNRMSAFLRNFPDIKLTYTPKREIPKPLLRFKPIPSEIQVREYQVSIRVAAPKYRRATIVLPTGAGKTITAGLITHELKVPTLFLTYSSILLYQTQKSFEKLLGVSVGVIGDGRFDLREITIATVQSILSILSGTEGFEEIAEAIKALQQVNSVDLQIPITAEKKSALINYLSRVQLVFVDEGHMLGAETIYTATRLCRPYYCFALTATPYRTDNREIFIEAATGPIWRPISEEELVKQGYVLPVKIAVAPYTHPVPNRLSSRRDSAKLYSRAISANITRNQLIIRIAKMCEKKYRTLILVKEIAHGLTLAKELNTAFIHSQTPEEEKNRIFQDFSDGKIRVLISSPILEQGVDIPAIELLFDATPRKSPIKILQTIGRARRPAPGKTHAYVITICDLDKGVYEKQSARKLDILKQANFEIMPFKKKEKS